MQVCESVAVIKLVVKLLDCEAKIVPHWIYTFSEDSIYAVFMLQ